MQPRLRKRRDFLKVANEGGFCPSSTVIVQYLALLPEQGEGFVLFGSDGVPEASSVCVGFTASKRVGNAVARNRAKRRLREAFEVVSAKLGLKDSWVVLIAKTATATAPYDDVLRDLTYALVRCMAGKFAIKRESTRTTRGKSSQK